MIPIGSLYYFLEDCEKKNAKRLKDEEDRRKEWERRHRKPKTKLVIAPKEPEEPKNPGPIVIGTGRTRHLIKPIVQQCFVDAVCEKIAQELTDTIEKEW